METQSSIRIPYELLTPQQKDEIVNGCGGKGSKVRPPKGIFYKASCNHHDYGYWVGCTDEQRLLCDKNLKKAMKDDCSKLPWWKQAAYRPWCYGYYRAIRIAGKQYFYYGEEKRWPVPTPEQLAIITNQEKAEC